MQKLSMAIATMALCVTGLAGCGQSAEARRQEEADRASFLEAKAAGEELSGMLDDLEARLYSGRATVRLWSEMQDRHGKVSALACKNAEMHLASIARLDSRYREKRHLAAARVAEARGTASDARVAGYRPPAGAAKRAAGRSE